MKLFRLCDSNKGRCQKKKRDYVGKIPKGGAPPPPPPVWEFFAHNPAFFLTMTLIRITQSKELHQGRSPQICTVYQGVTF